ncbi:MAG: hypothetical protein ACREGE_03415 [Candidatus Microsaccharimonas sp.]
METENPVVKGTEQALFLLTQKRSEAVFNELLEYATEVCLKKTPTYLAEHESSCYETISCENKIVQQLGARSLSTLLELKDGVHILDKGSSFHITEVLAEPESFSDQPNLRILENTERFGQAIIDESFSILGSDAHDWVRKLKNATTEDEEIAVVSWLDERIYNISNKSRSSSSEDDESAHFYPPHRISPKFIGSYPKLDVQPSCLSASIIAASFFERAEKPILHGGVTAPGNEAGTELLLHTLRKIANRSTESPTQNSDAQLHKLATIVQAASEWIKRPLAQHGALYVKLSNNWVQFDTYNNATHLLFDAETQHLDTLHEHLSEWSSVLPNLEFSTTILPDRGMQLATAEGSNLALALAEYEYPANAGLIETIAQALETIPQESYRSYLYDTCLKPLLDTRFHPFSKHGDVTLRTLLDGTLQEAETPKLQTNGMYDSTLRRIFEKALQGFVSWENTPDEFIAQCTTDPAYRRRRAEDFLSMPQVMAVFAAQNIAQADRGFGHLSVDIGNPAMRVGLATLSDFARYDSHPLPASFWATHWPGAVSLLENMDNPPASASDWKLTFNGLLSILVHPFTSSHNYDKINTFLSTYGKREDDGEQG